MTPALDQSHCFVVTSWKGRWKTVPAGYCVESVFCQDTYGRPVCHKHVTASLAYDIVAGISAFLEFVKVGT